MLMEHLMFGNKPNGMLTPNPKLSKPKRKLKKGSRKFTKWARELKDLKPWMEELWQILASPLEEGDAFQTVYWIWEANDNNQGKTVFQQAAYHALEGVVVSEGKPVDVKHFVSDYTKKTGTTPKIIFMNIRCEQDFVSYDAIENVKNMFFRSHEGGGMVSGPRPHVMIFANDGPIKPNMSKDRWKIGKLHADNITWI